MAAVEYLKPLIPVARISRAMDMPRSMSLRALKERHGIDLKSAVNLLREKNMVRMST